jgi:outer membrane protein OmpA-like peptidoglycan-associated protein
MQIAPRIEAAVDRKVPRPPTSPAQEHPLFRLQRMAGNAAVSQWIVRARGSATAMVARCPDCGDTCKDAECGELEQQLARAVVQRAPDVDRGTPDCPGYEQGEQQRSHSAAGILGKDVLPRGSALLVVDFGVNQSAVKAQAKNDADLQAWLTEFESNSTYRISILGVDDCVGDRTKREQLRKQRAEAVRAILGPEAQKRVLVADGAPVDEYTADNTSSGGRAMNRGALIMFMQELDMEPIEVTAKPAPKPPRRKTVDCNAAQADALSKSHAIAIRMVEKAMASIPGAHSTDPLVKALLRKYFRDDGVSTHMHVRDGFHGIMRGLKDDFKFECEDDDSLLCGPPTVAYVLPIVGFRVHICERAFGDDNELAATIIHECAHMYDFSFGDTYCEGGCPASMDRWDAYSNADSYSEFAQEVFTAI